MKYLTRSAWLKSMLSLALILSVARCGDDSEVIIEELDCMVEGFEGGSYTFTVDSVSNNCGLDESLLDQFVSAGDQVGPVVLPGVQDLPATINIPFDPPIGTVTVDIAVQGDRLQVGTEQPITILVPGWGTFTGTVSGNLCPLAEGEVAAAFTISITSPLITCNVPLTATGR